MNLSFRILFLFFFVALGSYAQNIEIFKSGFENTISNDWSASSGNNLLVFERATEAKRSGDFGFHMKFDNISGSKGNLTTPKIINWEDGKTYRISFYYKIITPDKGNDSHIKTFKGDAAKFGLHLDVSGIKENDTSSGWLKFEDQVTPDFNSNAGYFLLTIRNSDSGGGEYYFDDFLVEEIVPETGFFVDIKTKDIASDPSIKWVQFGPGMSGNNTCFYTHPTDPNFHYTSPNMGNSYRSTDKGFTYETILNEDQASYSSGERGPIEMFSMDFSRQDENFGFSSGKRKGELYFSTNKGKTWELQKTTQSVIGDNFLSCVSVDPTNDNIWFLGAGKMRDYGRLLYPLSAPKGTHVDTNANGRIWKSTNKGQTWTLSNTGINANAEFESIIVDPINPTIVYAGTNYGFYKSTNSGVSWTLKSNGIDHNMIRSMDLHHNKINNQITIYALSNVTWKANGTSVENDQGGVFKSTDRGETWTNANGNIAINLSKFSGNYDIEKDYYLSIAHYFGLASWTDAKATYPTLPTNINTRFNMITVDPNDVNNVYLVNNYSNASENNFKPGQIWRTTNGGTNWFVTLRNGKNWNNGNDDSYWVTERNNPMGTNITMKYKSDWVNRDNYERKGCNFTKFNADGSVLYTQMAKIGLVSYDKGTTWLDIDDKVGTNPHSWVGAGNSNVPGHGFYQSELHPDKVFCASGENSLWITNNDGEGIRPGAQGAEVLDITGGEHSVSSIAIHLTDPTIWYATFFRQDKKGQVLKSTNSGETWASIGTPIPSPWPELGGGDQSVHQLSFIIDKENPNNMYFCVPRSTLKLEWVGDSVTAWGVHKSTDGGVTWTQQNNGLPASLDVARLVFDPNNSSILYAAVINDNGGLFKSIDKGLNWVEVASTNVISGSSGINDIHFDVDGKAYITAGFKNENSDVGGLWVSDDNMQTWIKKFDYPWTNRVEVAKYDSKTILLSTLPNKKVNYKNPGTYLSKDSGDTWVKINIGNGQSDRVNDIAINYSIPGKYYASTRGSGWYVATDPNPNTLSVASILDKDVIRIYPNPVSDILNVSGVNDRMELKIYSIEGTFLKTFKGNLDNTFNLSSLKSGIYVYLLSNQDKTTMKSGEIIKN
jgi:photosystem II stability/assembly factor-like uncharacterized protein